MTTHDLIERLRARNYPTHTESVKLPGRCSECYQPWPCDPAASNMERAEAADRIEQLETDHKALVAHLLALAYPEHEPADYADHATGVADLIGLFQPHWVIDPDLFGHKRALIIGPPYTTDEL